MSKDKIAGGDQGTGSDFVSHQQARDQAKNERTKSAQGEAKIDPEQAEREDAQNEKTDVSTKKTGGGKQVSPGT